MKRNIYKDLFYLIITLSILALFIGLYFKYFNKKEGLSKEDRTIISGIYMGMPQDSLISILENNSEKKLLYISDLADMWSTGGYIRGNARPEFTTDIFKFSNWPSQIELLGIYKSVILNNRVSEVFLMLGSTPKNAASGDVFNQYVSEQLLNAIEEQLIKNYGPDSSIVYGLETFSTLDLRASKFGERVSGISKVKRFKAKFGHVDLIFGIESNLHTWNKVPSSENPGSFSYEYYTMNAPTGYPIAPHEKVWLLPCIHYVVDDKYYEELKLKLKL